MPHRTDRDAGNTRKRQSVPSAVSFSLGLLIAKLMGVHSRMLNDCQRSTRSDMGRMLRQICTLALLWFVALHTVQILALDQDNLWRGWPSEFEFLTAPDYCKARFTGVYFHADEVPYLRYPESEKRKWEQRLGGVYKHMHHYCFGLVLLSRAQSPSWLRRHGHRARGVFDRAAGEIGYTVRADTPQNPLWLRMRLDLARAYEGAGDRDAAINLFKQMLARFPDQTAVYVAQAQMADRAGERDQAIQILLEGERNARSKGAIYFELAHLYFDRGDKQHAEIYTTKAEQAGLNMAKMRKRLADINSASPGEPTTVGTQSVLPTTATGTSD